MRWGREARQAGRGRPRSRGLAFWLDALSRLWGWEQGGPDREGNFWKALSREGTARISARGQPEGCGMGRAAREEQAQAITQRAWSRGGGNTLLSGLSLGPLSPEKERRKGQAREGIGQGLTWFVCESPNTHWARGEGDKAAPRAGLN